ncbi:MAG: pseudouridine synthase [Simkaniaceae bacterium]
MMQEKRLSKTLQSAGIASRRGAEALIFDGHVKVNGVVIKKPETHVDPENDQILVHDRPVKPVDEKFYFVLNKPRGYVCSNKKIDRKKLVVDLFSNLDARLFTVGRLDRDTTGLLILTNDGHFANKVIHPSSNIEKEYLVKVKEEVTDEHLKRISRGGMVEEFFVKPKSVKKVRKGTIKIVVKEGKKREVRRFIEKASLSLLELKRIRIGNLRLGPLEEGQYRSLNEKERELIFFR